MSVSSELRELVRQRPGFACQFCEVTEVDTGGELTIDHYRPVSRGGESATDNLLYCCVRCNQYKLDYWPSSPTDVPLWNPIAEPRSLHLFALDDGALYPLTQVGAFTIARLRLNRAPLVAYRRQRRQRAEEVRLLTQYRDTVHLLAQLQRQVMDLLDEQQRLLSEQRELLNLLLKRRLE